MAIPAKVEIHVDYRAHWPSGLRYASFFYWDMSPYADKPYTFTVTGTPTDSTGGTKRLVITEVASGNENYGPGGLLIKRDAGVTFTPMNPPVYFAKFVLSVTVPQ